MEETEALEEIEALEESDSEEVGVVETDFLRRKIVLEETVNKTTRMSTSTADLEEEDLVPEEVEIVLIHSRTVLVAIVSRTTETSTSTIRCLENEHAISNTQGHDTYEKKTSSFKFCF